MHTLPTQCPFCSGEVTVTKIYCRECDTTYEGRFSAGTFFAQLSSKQLEFVETFVRCEGKINRMEQELNLSYPTIRNRLHEVIRAMGHEPGAPEDGALSETARRKVLEDLDAGQISYEDAIKLLEEGEA
ncbi:MAG: DUF2089 domain-containing protein [Chloroflexi bacterium]|jgi:hypothetical protein|nr:DUF2089 domain-containing protein [Chloroflexota bacterium]